MTRVSTKAPLSDNEVLIIETEIGTFTFEVVRDLGYGPDAPEAERYGRIELPENITVAGPEATGEQLIILSADVSRDSNAS